MPYCSEAWAGYLNGAWGVGALLAATASAVLIGRRLGVPIVAAALMLSVVLTALSFGIGLGGTVVLLAVTGTASTMLKVALCSMLQRRGSSAEAG